MKVLVKIRDAVQKLQTIFHVELNFSSCFSVTEKMSMDERDMDDEELECLVKIHSQ